MENMRTITKYFILGLLGIFILSGSAQASSFLEGYEDIPIMRGLQQIPHDNISFGNEESRLIEAILTSSKVGFKTVQKFYIETLPQLGWKFQGKRADTLIFDRDGETLEIAKESAKPLTVRFTIKSKM